MLQKKIILPFSLLLNVIVILAVMFYYWQRYTVIKPYADNTGQDTVKYFCEKNLLFKNLSIDSNDVVFLGDSYIDNYAITEIFGNLNIKNRGIQGAKIINLVHLIDSSYSNNPTKIFIYIGINDIISDTPLNTSLKNYKLLIDKIRAHTKVTEIFYISVLPLRNNSKYCINCNNEIINLNKKLSDLCKSEGVDFLDFYESFAQQGQLNIQYSINDGAHLNEIGYQKLTSLLKDYIY